MFGSSPQDPNEHDHKSHHRPFADGGSHDAPFRGRSGRGHGGFPPFGGPGFGGGFGGGHGFGGPGPRGFMGGAPARRRKGAARDAILSLLADAPANGYGLIKAISERTGGSWSPSPGSVYPTLQQLVDEGLIEAINDDKRTDFQLTDEGKRWVTDHAEELSQVWEGATDHAEANADLADSVAKLMGVVHQFRFAASDDQRTLAVGQLDDARRALYRILGE